MARLASLEYLQFGTIPFRDFSPFWIRSFDPGTQKIDTSDLDNPVYDTTYAGFDLHRGPTWTFEFIVEGKTEAEVLDNLAKLQKEWRSPGYPGYTKTPGQNAWLIYIYAGRKRTVYGRPRRLAVADISTSQQGFVSVLADFQLMDPLHYSSSWVETGTLLSVPPTTYGLQEHLEEYLTTEPGGTRQGTLSVETDAPAPFRIRVQGPGTDPSVTISGRRYSFDTTLSASQYIELDSLAGTVRINGKNAIYAMTTPTPIKRIRLNPGNHEISFRIDDPTLSAKAVYSYRQAFYSF